VVIGYFNVYYRSIIMGYFKELMIENEEYFHEMVADNGIEIDGIIYNDAEVLLSEKPDHYYSALEAFISEIFYEV
jgi:tryptophan synthase alpha subunit